jgi:hypothetical protein
MTEAPKVTKLTKPQAVALAKWRDGKAQNDVWLRVRYNVFERLRKDGMLHRASHMAYVISPEGVKALAAYEDKKGPIP